MAASTTPRLNHPPPPPISRLSRPGACHAAAHADHGARAGAGLYRPGPRHRRRPGRPLLPRAALRSRPTSTGRSRDRFLLSTGHYSIALWAALAEAGIIPVDELATYGADDSRLEMSTLDTTPGVEMIGGSLGHGLGQAVGMALGLRLDGSAARVFVELSDGEMQEGSTWEAAMAASHFKLDDLVALIDCNGIQADGAHRPRHGAGRRQMARLRLGRRSEIDGNDMEADRRRAGGAREPQRQAQGDRAADAAGQGRADAREREKAHFVRVEPREWDALDRASSKRAAEARSAERACTLADGRRTRRSARAERRRAVRPGAGRARPRARPTSSGSPPTSASTPTSCRSATPSPTASSMSAWPSRTSSPSRPASPAPAWSRSPPPTASSPRAAPTTSSPSPCAHCGLQREDHRRAAGPDHRLWRHAPGDRGPGADAHDPRPHRHRPLRRDRDRGRRRAAIADHRRSGLHAAPARQRARRARSRRLSLRDRQGAAAARGQRRRHRLDRA